MYFMSGDTCQLAKERGLPCSWIGNDEEDDLREGLYTYVSDVSDVHEILGARVAFQVDQSYETRRLDRKHPVPSWQRYSAITRPE